MSGETIFITTGKPISDAILAASPADLATPSFGTGMPYASHTSLPSGAVRLVRLSALTASSILRTASLEFDIGFLPDDCFYFAAAHAASNAITCAHSIHVPGCGKRGSASAATFLRPVIGSLWHLVCQKQSCQGGAVSGNAENMGNLTFWHLV